MPRETSQFAANLLKQAGAVALVPIQQQALSWAVEESGISVADIDQHLRVPAGTVDGWIGGRGQPNRTQFKRLKSLLKRPASVFFMDTPPETAESAVAMRFAFGATSRSRSPEERQAIRDASRVRKFVGDIRRDLEQGSPAIPSASTNEDPEEVATTIRNGPLNVPIEEQMSWASPTEAFKRWRALIEGMDILVFLYSLGESSARGFSFATDPPPVIGISTTWHASVRVYTLLHEFGHVLTRTSSSCTEDTVGRPTEDPVERWCESFAASFLMPRHEVRTLIGRRNSTDPIATATWLAGRLSVSRKSALLRLVELGAAQWGDFRRLESRFERKSAGGRADPANPRTRDVTRRETYGRCLSTVRSAHDGGLVSEADIRTYLRMYPDELK